MTAGDGILADHSGGETIHSGYSPDGTSLSVYWTMLGKRRDLLCQGPNFPVFRRKVMPAGSAFAMAALGIYSWDPPSVVLPRALAPLDVESTDPVVQTPGELGEGRARDAQERLDLLRRQLDPHL